MSGPLINRSLTTLRTELEFLRDSEIITEELFDKITGTLPVKYEKGMKPWGVDKLEGGAVGAAKAPETDGVSEKLSQMSLNRAPPPPAPPAAGANVLGYCRSLYDYQSQEPGDLRFNRDDKIAVIEHLSEDWWKGYKQNTSAHEAGVFPSNYVSLISLQEFEHTSRKTDEKAAYNPGTQLQHSANSDPPPQYNMPPPQQLSAQPSYGGYAQYPPPPTNYYSPQQYNQAPVSPAPAPAPAEQQAPVQGHGTNPHIKKFGSKLGNAAIFGAGATIGSDIVNSIF